MTRNEAWRKDHPIRSRNPIAAVVRRKRPTVVPSKKVYNRKKEATNVSH